jgi:two-component system, NarL family, nitrate/nitrite response regulator NarL
MVARCVNIVIAAHQPIFLCGLMTTLRTEHDLNVVASCRDGVTCLQAIRDLLPCLVVLDSSLPDQGALHVLTAVSAEKLSTQVIILSDSGDPARTAGLARQGASCVISTDVSRDALVRCLRQLTGRRESAVVPKTLVSMNGHNRSASALAADPSIALTERERQIMHLVCEGLSNKDIGRQFRLSDGTVKVHLHHIYEKLAIHNRTALAMLAAGNLNSYGSGRTKRPATGDRLVRAE